MPLFYPSDRLPHRLDFEVLAAHCPVACLFLRDYRSGTIDYETCLLGTALALADQNKRLLDDLVSLNTKIPTVFVFPDELKPK